jgi:pimeloyl-ACP methyl ester carboxylesterase
MYERYGDGAPSVVALHGWGRDRRDWDPVLRGTAAYALDLPGFGLSPAPPAGWGAQEYSRFLAPLFDELDPVVLVGHSFGGRIALHLAADRPDRFRGVVLTGTPVFRVAPAGRPKAAFRLARSLHRLHLLGDERMEAYRRKYGSADYRQARGVMREVLVRVVNEEYGDALKRLQVPLALVWGEQDTAVPLAVVDRIRAVVPDAQLDVVAGSGHLVDDALADRIRDRIAAMTR